MNEERINNAFEKMKALKEEYEYPYREYINSYLNWTLEGIEPEEEFVEVKEIEDVEELMDCLIDKVEKDPIYHERSNAIYASLSVEEIDELKNRLCI